MKITDNIIGQIGKVGSNTPGYYELRLVKRGSKGRIAQEGHVTPEDWEYLKTVNIEPVTKTYVRNYRRHKKGDEVILGYRFPAKKKITNLKTVIRVTEPDPTGTFYSLEKEVEVPLKKLPYPELHPLDLKNLIGLKDAPLIINNMRISVHRQQASHAFGTWHSTKQSRYMIFIKAPDGKTTRRENLTKGEVEAFLDKLKNDIL